MYSLDSPARMANNQLDMAKMGLVLCLVMTTYHNFI